MPDESATFTEKPSETGEPAAPPTLAVDSTVNVPSPLSILLGLFTVLEDNAPEESIMSFDISFVDVTEPLTESPFLTSD